MFIQVSALDKSGAGIAVNENGAAAGRPEASFGTIADGTQIAAQGPNRNFPGLVFSFDVPLRLGNGNLVPAGRTSHPVQHHRQRASFRRRAQYRRGSSAARWRCRRARRP
jgi:hypothetical protein